MAIPASSAAKHARSHFLARILSPCTIDIATAIATRHRGTRPFRRNKTLANALSEATQIRCGDGKEKKSKPCTCAPCSIAKTFHKSNHVQLMESEEAARSALATVKAQNAQMIADKEKEIVELNRQILELSRRVLPYKKLVGDNPQLSLLIDDFHRKASRKKNTAMPSKNDWGRLVHLFAQSQLVAYASIGRENVLSTQELRACILLLLDFTNSEVISLLDISDQRMTNIRASINYKLFKDTGASSLNKNLKGITMV